MKIIIKLGIIVILIILLSNLVTAIGISPGQVKIDFEPNLEQKIKLNIINNEHKNVKIAVYPRGELSNYITLNEELTFSQDQETKEIIYKLKLPENLEKPGIHKEDIVAIEIAEGSNIDGAVIGVTQSVISQLKVRVPYPGKYAEAFLEVLSGENNQLKFIVPVSNYGKENIKSAKAKIEIYDNSNRKIKTLETDEKEIAIKTKRELLAVWDPDVAPGIYHAIATVNYDGKEIKTESDFVVGEKALEILSITVSDFTLGQIAKFTILIENKWNQKIKDVYARIKIIDEEGNLISDFKSNTRSIEPLVKSALESYLDTKDLEEGVYDSTLILGYEDKEIQRRLTLEVGFNQIKVTLGGITGEVVREGNVSKTSTISLAIIVFLIINVLWIWYLRKRKK